MRRAKSRLEHIGQLNQKGTQEPTKNQPKGEESEAHHPNQGRIILPAEYGNARQTASCSKGLWQPGERSGSRSFSPARVDGRDAHNVGYHHEHGTGGNAFHHALAIEVGRIGPAVLRLAEKGTKKGTDAHHDCTGESHPDQVEADGERAEGMITPNRRDHMHRIRIRDIPFSRMMIEDDRA